MRTIVHLSDLHFGAINERTLRPLIDAVTDLRPDAVAVSGDLTQRARVTEFRRARAFLDALPSPQIVVPGNHDIPLHNPFGRFWSRLSRYRRYITADLEPFLVDDEIAIAGLNTARSWTIKGGRVNEHQAARICAHLDAAPATVMRIIVAHHPFDLPEGLHDRHLVGRARLAMGLFARSRTDLFLTGHLHATRTGDTAARYRIPGHSALVVQAGTATSRRERSEANSFNALRIDRSQVIVDRLIWNANTGGFDRAHLESFERADDGWRPRPPA
jgi:3',5'-cyclic AMP phosphodiesterase CpdA